MISLINRLSVSLPCDALLTIYKSCIRLHLDYDDVKQTKWKKLNIEIAFFYKIVNHFLPDFSSQENYL